MSAIKNFFDHSREVARLSKERAIEKQHKLQTPTKVVVDTTYEDNLLKEEIKYFDGVLRRNWFIDDNDIVELLNDASENAYNHIVENLNSYSSRVQRAVINNYFPARLSEKTVIELTDHDMIERYIRADEAFDREIEEAWQKEIKKSGISRPDGELEDTLEEKTEELSKQMKLLEQEKTKKTGAYVPPSMRNMKKEINPAVTKLEEIVGKLENEIVKLKKQIQQEEKNWYADRKSEFTNKWLSMPIMS